MKIVFSFDDNHALNIKVADLLEKYGFRATFFINTTPLAKHTGMNPGDINQLYRRGHEIAAHTFNHIQFSLLNREQIQDELKRGKETLEHLIGTTIIGFAYPKGQYTDEVKEEVKEAGYVYARTTGEGSIKIDKDRFAIIPTMQIYNQPYHRILRVKRNLLEGTHFSWTGDWKESCKKYVKNNRGIVHIFGHSWEIDKLKLWHELEDMLKWIKTNNYEVVDGIGAVLK